MTEARRWKIFRARLLIQDHRNMKHRASDKYTLQVIGSNWHSQRRDQEDDIAPGRKLSVRLID